MSTMTERDEAIANASRVARRVSAGGSAGIDGEDIWALVRGFAVLAREDIERTQRSRSEHDDLLAIHKMTECVAAVGSEPEPDEHLTVRNVRNLCTLLNRVVEGSQRS